MTCRRADGASLSARHNIHREQKRIKFFITRFPASQLFAPLSRAKPAPAGEISPRALTFLTIERDAPERAPSRQRTAKIKDSATYAYGNNLLTTTPGGRGL
jgi:hypothetical protein